MSKRTLDDATRAETAPDARGEPGADRMIPFLTAPKLSIRSVRLVAVGAILFLVVWNLGCLFLPEGMLRTPRPEGVAAGWEAVQMGSVLVAAGVLLGNLLIRVRGFPLGYLAAAGGFLWYGLVAGTNSFILPYSQRALPTLRIVSRGGAYSMIAWALLTSASCFWSRFELTGPSMKIVRTDPRRRASTPEILTATVGLAVLAAAVAAEAFGILPA